MNPQSQQKIIDCHGPLVSHPEDPSQGSKPGAPSLENSGPPSPSSGPIINFGEVVPGLYRSSFPRFGNFEHLQSLGLKTILCAVLPPLTPKACKLTGPSTLVGEVYPVENIGFMEKHDIQHYQIPIPAHKDPSVVIPPENIAHALRLMLDPSNYPMLVHCNKGKVILPRSALFVLIVLTLFQHRTGCIVACFRKLHDEWTTDIILTEFVIGSLS